MTTYIDNTLLKDEHILYNTKPHLAVFYMTFIWVLVAIFFYIFTFNAFFIHTILFIALISFINDLIKYYFTEYVITNKRVVAKVGFIRRQALEIFLNKIEGVYVEQGIAGRMLDFGTIVITGIGGTKNFFYFIKKPLLFRENAQKQQLPGN